MSRSLSILAPLGAVFLLSACVGSDLERGALGAAGGAAVAELTDSDVVAGALIGGAAGVFCDDAGVCSRR